MEEIRIEGEANSNQQTADSWEPKAGGRRNLPKWVWITTLIILLLGGISLAYWIYKTDVFGDLTRVTKVSPSESPKIVNNTPCPLDGVMTTKERAERRPLGIMVENAPEARPQSGLDKASFIFETPSEGGITRFLVFFVENDASEVGPVRSARTYYVDWADEVRAIYAHAGGSAIALENLANDKYLCDINHDQDHFWRDNSRFAPHNLYTTTDKIRAAASAAKCSQKADYKGYQFKPAESPAGQSGGPASNAPQGEALGGDDVKTITVNFSSALFQVVYNYDSEKNIYLRNLGGTPHKDKVTGAQLAPKTVVVMHADRVTSSSDGTQQSHAVTTGTGKAEVYLDGKEIKGAWKRTNIPDRTKFYDELDKEIIFNRGQIWVEVLSPTGSAASS